MPWSSGSRPAPGPPRRRPPPARRRPARGGGAPRPARRCASWSTDLAVGSRPAAPAPRSAAPALTRDRRRGSARWPRRASARAPPAPRPVASASTRPRRRRGAARAAVGEPASGPCGAARTAWRCSSCRGRGAPRRLDPLVRDGCRTWWSATAARRATASVPSSSPAPPPACAASTPTSASRTRDGRWSSSRSPRAAPACRRAPTSSAARASRWPGPCATSSRSWRARRPPTWSATVAVDRALDRSTRMAAAPALRLRLGRRRLAAAGEALAGGLTTYSLSSLPSIARRCSREQPRSRSGAAVLDRGAPRQRLRVVGSCPPQKSQVFMGTLL